MATNANSENARSRMEASSAGKHWYGAKEDESKYWVRLACCVSPSYGLFLLGVHFETYGPFISFIFKSIFGLRLTVYTESADTGARLYTEATENLRGQWEWCHLRLSTVCLLL
jgi:hypothetical protein